MKKSNKNKIIGLSFWGALITNSIGLWITNQISPYYEISMLNVGNAMSILLSSPWKKVNLLIDAGNEWNYNRKNIIINYLRAQGIHQLEGVFITHNHADHNNNLPFLNSQLSIHNFFDNRNQMSVYSFNNAFIINNISYYHQSETQSLSENNRSLVLLFKLFNIRFLITGDIEIIGLQLMEKDFQKIDKIELIQIPHHGSKTGFFLPILNKWNCEYGLVSARKTILRPFPNALWINYFNESSSRKLLITEKNGSISIKIYLNHYTVKTLFA